MLNITTFDKIIAYLILAYALAVGTSRGGIHTVPALLALLCIIRYLTQPYAIPIEPPLKRAFLIFFGSIFLSLIFSHDIVASAKSFVMHLYMFIPFLAAVKFLHHKDNINRFVFFSTFSLLAGSLVTIYQGLSGITRASGFFGIMDFAGVLGLLIPVIIAHAVTNDTMKRNTRIFLLIVSFIAMLALLYNGTRGVWVSTIATIAILTLLELGRNKKILFYSLFLSICLVTFIYHNDAFWYRIQTIPNTTSFNSNLERLMMWKYAAETFYSHPLFGVGLGAFLSFPFPGSIQEYGHVHNNILQILAMSGIIGLVGYFYLMGTICLQAYKKSSIPDLRVWGLTIILCTTELIIHGMFDYTFVMGPVMYTYSFLIGISFAAFAIRDEERHN